MSQEITRKHPHLAKNKGFLHHDNARLQICAVAMVKLHELKLELLQHPPYSPGLTPDDFFLFQTWKNGLAERDLSQARASLPKQRPILYTEKNS